MTRLGRWRYHARDGLWLLSQEAAALLARHAPPSLSTADLLALALPVDRATLSERLGCMVASTGVVDHEFRVLHAEGLRWLRLIRTPSEPGTSSTEPAGLLLDMTDMHLSVMRERFYTDSLHQLIGTRALGEMIRETIRLVCENLDWEYGGYWAPSAEILTDPPLVCQHWWHKPGLALAPFIDECRTVRLAPGEGLIGQVWSSRQPGWVEDMPSDLTFVRRHAARASGLRTVYAFPITHFDAAGRHYSHGVMEFVSRLPRQQEAQLPALAASIAPLIAQAVQRIKQQELSQRLAQLDDLTGLSNRRHFQERLDAACRRAALPEATPFAILNIDLDHFKPVNDAFGHEAGNVVLREFARRLQALAPTGGCAGRLGGDEFALLVTDDDTTRLQELAQQVLLAARSPFWVDGKELHISASVGIGIYPQHGSSGPTLMRSADAAMYRSKQSGRNVWSLFTAAAVTKLDERRATLAHQLTLETRLHHALAEDAFHLEYQPIVQTDSGHLVALEALIRWRQADGTTIAPDVFIPIAEQSRLIVEVGRWVRRRACEDLARLQRAGWGGLTVHVNLAAAEFVDAELPMELLNLIRTHSLRPAQLCLELTEGTVMKQPNKALAVMQALRATGFGLSLDDFGTGHSSMARLKDIPLSSLKIDRSFVRGLPGDRGNVAIVRALLTLGQQLRLPVIAEGVENDIQLGYLRQFGCPLVQGFALGRPCAIEHLLNSSFPVTTAPSPTP